MRKVLVTLCIMGLLMGIASMAMAAVNQETNWAVMLRGSDQRNDYSNGPIVSLGTKSGATDGFDSGKDLPLSATGSNQAMVASYHSEPGWTGSAFVSQDWKAPINPKGTMDQRIKEWSLRFWLRSSFNGTSAKLNYFAANATDYLLPPAAINGAVREYWIRVDHDPTGCYADGYKQQITANTAGTYKLPIGSLTFDKNLNNIRCADSEAAANGVQLTLMAVPEPGSFLALGSGLVGLLGFAVRRRRA